MAAINLHEPIFRYPKGVGYKVYAFQAGGTSIPVSTFADVDGNPNPWPVVLAADSNGDGTALIYVTESVTIDLQDTAGVTQEGYPAEFIRGATVADLQDAIQGVNDQLEDQSDGLFLLQSRATDLESRATDLEDRATSLESRATSLESRATSLEGRATSLESRATAVEGRATSLEGRMTTAESNIGILNTDAEAASAAITTLQSQMTAANDNIVVLNTDAEAASAAITTLQGQMTTAQSAITTLQGQMTTATTDIGTLNDAVEALQDAVDGLTLSVGGSNYSWDKESQTLTSWGTFSTASDGRTTVYYPLSYDVIPVVMLTTISAALFVTSTLTALDTISFSVYACNIDGSGTHVMAVDGRWLAVGKKAA